VVWEDGGGDPASYPILSWPGKAKPYRTSGKAGGNANSFHGHTRSGGSDIAPMP